MAGFWPTTQAEQQEINLSLSDSLTRIRTMLDNLDAHFSPSSDIFEIPDYEPAPGTTNMDQFEGFAEGILADVEARITAIDNLVDSFKNLSTYPATPYLPTIDTRIDVRKMVSESDTSRRPNLSVPNIPQLDTVTKPSSPAVNDITLPDTPTYSIPNVPQLANVTIPDLVSVSFPTFQRPFPADPEITVPDGAFEYNEPEYTSEELTLLRFILTDDMQNGGWGVTHTDEEALFEREVDRAQGNARRTEEDIIRSMASRGFEAPQGELIKQLEENKNETLKTLNDANRDITVLRADLIRKAREFSIATAQSLNQTMVTHFGFARQRVLEAARLTADFALREVGVAVDIYNMKVEAYSSYARAYEVHVRAQLAQLEAQKLELEAASLKVGINQSQIDLYVAQYRAVEAQVNIYNNEVQAASVLADIERTKTQVFATQVGAFRAEIEANTAKIQQYVAQIEGESTKVDMYKTEVDAYRSKVDANRSEVQADVSRALANIQAQRLKLEGFSSEVSIYSEKLRATEAQYNSQIAELGTKGALYTNAGNVAVAGAELSAELTKHIRDSEENTAKIRISENKTRADIAQARSTIRVDSAVQSVEQYSNYLQGIGAFASMIDISTATS